MEKEKNNKGIIIVLVVIIVILLALYKKSVMAIALSAVFSSIVLSLIVMITSKKYNDYISTADVASRNCNISSSCSI